ncbi:iron-containing redox enzyme family protein [soil metagenome]
MTLPSARGPLSATVLSLLSGHDVALPVVAVRDPLADDDLQLALFLCFELHYRGFEGVSDLLEWDPALLGFRRDLEQVFEGGLRSAFGIVPTEEPIDVQLRALIGADSGESLSSFLARHGTVDMYREFAMQRSAYHLKEGDPHSFGIPRLRGGAKVALLEIQHDEYGGGEERWMHSTLFASTMRGLGLDDKEGAYIDRLPGATLATTNLISLFGLHRRMRGALVGHLAAFEMTSCIPNRRYGDGLRRLGYDEQVTRYFDEHVEADAAHATIASHDLAGSLVEQEPHLDADILFGAAALLGLEGRVASDLLQAWRQERSSLFAVPSGVS